MGLTSIIQNTATGLLNPLLNLFSSTTPYRGADFPDGFFIEELDQNNQPILNANGEAFIIILKGSNMPEKMFPFGGKQAIVKEYYPGNSEPTMQIMGGRENNIKVTGVLKDRRLETDSDRAKNYGSSETLALELDALRQRGNILRISLGDIGRYCYLEEASFEMITRGRITYALDFSIIGEDPPSDCKLLDDTIGIPMQDTTQLVAAMAAFDAVQSTIPSEMPTDIFDTINGLISAIATPIAALTKFVDNTLRFADDTKGLASRGIGLVKSVNVAFADFNRRVGALPAAVGETKIEGTTVISQSKVLINQRYLAELIHAPYRPQIPISDAQKAAAASKVSQFSDQEDTQKAATDNANFLSLASLVLSIGKQLEALRATEPLLRHRVIEGDTLQKLAARYYGDATLWEDIYEHNNLLSVTINSGDVLEIPKL